MPRKRTMYSMHHQVSTLGQIGRLTPFLFQEVAPGDTWSGRTGILLRMSPMEHALLSDLYIDLIVAYIPHRLVMADWEDFIAEGPMDTPTYSVPTITIGAGSTAYQSIFWRPNGATTTTYNALRLYAYNLLWNEFMRDHQDAIAVPTAQPGQYGLLVNFKKDYWTTLQDVQGFGQPDHFFDTNVGSGTQASAQDVLEAIARQKIALKRATYGTKYIDILRSYGINVNYQMLQRPEVVAIGRSVANITDVVSTAEGATKDVGYLAGHGISGTRLTVRRKTFPEHGTLIGCAIVRPPFIHPGVGDWFARARDYSSFYDPGLVPMPPVAVEKQDPYPSMDLANRTDVVGYQPWGQWYRRAQSLVHIGLDSTFAPLAILPGNPTSTDFRNIAPADYNAAFTSTNFEHFQLVAVHKLRALRLLPRSNVSTVTGMAG